MAYRSKITRVTELDAIEVRRHKLLTEIETRIESKSGNTSVADYNRMSQLEQELDEDERPPSAKSSLPGQSTSFEMRASQLARRL